MAKSKVKPPVPGKATVAIDESWRRNLRSLARATDLSQKALVQKALEIVYGNDVKALHLRRGR